MKSSKFLPELARDFSEAIAVSIFFLAAQPSFSVTISAGYNVFRSTGAGKDFSETPIPGTFFDPGSSDF